MFHVVFADVIIETVTGFLGLLCVFTILIALGVDPRPADAMTAISGDLAAICFGIGIGTINVETVAFFPAWIMGYQL
ncbi:hypothetical protein [Methylobacterium durans]|uniref:hypothetical protein n=1 Tax=Methylobacterium durans TaxID=2202825 RepID=UPI001F44ED8B|nr:hypothetical protein [Methylobacterium durans]